MLLPSQFRHRQRLDEIMDQPDLDSGVHRQALEGLGRINQVSNASNLIIRQIARFADDYPATVDESRPLRILDLATGGGDLPIAIARWGRRAGIAVQVAGCDISDTALEFARQRAAAQKVAVHFFELDLLHEEIPAGFDVICSTLFLHHLDDSDIVRLLAKCRTAAGRMIVMSDLRRGMAGYLLAWTATRVLSQSSVVHHDGPVSVRAACTLAEIRRLANEAGLSGAVVRRKWPLRFLLTWNRN